MKDNKNIVRIKNKTNVKERSKEKTASP